MRDSSYRVVVCVALGLVVCLVLVLGPAWFFAIPWPWRQGAGRLLFLAMICVGLRRLLIIRTTDCWPATDAAIASANLERPQETIESALPWLLQLLVWTLAWPLLRAPSDMGRGDWDLYLQWYEVARQTILRWRQVPWWNPFVRGGFPLAGEPQFGLASIDTPLVLLLGTSVGLRVATLCYLSLSVEGARRLARLWLGDPWAAAAAGIVFGLNGGILVLATGGHGIPMSYCFLPWIPYYVARLERRLSDGFLLGVWCAVNVLTAIQYATAFALWLGAAVWLRALVHHRGPARRTFLTHTLVAAGVCLLLASWRLAITGLVMSDYPRQLWSGIDRTVFEMLRPLVWPTRLPIPFLMDLENETAAYIGVLAAALAVWSVRFGWRWWHTLTVLAFAMALGSQRWYQPSYWVHDWPVFSTMHRVEKWRLLAMLGVALCVAACVARWRSSNSRFHSRLAVLATVITAADLTSYGHYLFPIAFEVEPAEGLLPGLPIHPIVSVEYAEMPQPGYGLFGQTLGFASTLRGYAVVRGFEPQMGYNRSGPTARLWRGHSDYCGEFWTDDGPITPEFWSPNHVRLRARPGQDVSVNQNPGSWWVVNGRRPFASMRCAEWQEPFVVEADANGMVELKIRPKGLALGAVLSAAGLVLLVSGLVAVRHWRGPIRSCPSNGRSAAGATTEPSAC
jgi:hypothetical protein